jgi:HlyD family secretion protein
MKKFLIGIVVIAVAGGGIAANLYWKEPAAPEVATEAVEARDLTATVSGSGAIRPAREVDISSQVMGRTTRLEVIEGQIVNRGDLLIEIDPRRLTSQVDQMQANLESARTQVRLAEESLSFARQQLDRREGLYQQELISYELYEQALQETQRAERTLETRRIDVTRLEAALAQAEVDLSQVIISSPIDGIITRLNIEEGENVMTGTMNNPGTVIMTIADLSIIEAEIEVDETDIVSVEMGQDATVTIDAFPDVEFSAVVTEVGKSPINPQAAASGQAINFKVVVRLNDTVPGARPGLSCTSDIVTSERSEVLAVPIQALILREVEFDENGEVVREWEELLALGGEDDSSTEEGNGTPAAPTTLAPPATAAGSNGSGESPQNGSARSDSEREKVEVEGAFILRDGRAIFVPIEIGIAGERHFQVLSGVEAGDKIITGPFDIIRTLLDGDRVSERDSDGEEGSDRE